MTVHIQLLQEFVFSGTPCEHSEAMVTEGRHRLPLAIVVSRQDGSKISACGECLAKTISAAADSSGTIVVAEGQQASSPEPVQVPNPARPGTGWYDTPAFR